MQLDVLFISGIFPKEKEKEIISKSKNNIQLAANNFQWNLIEGMDANCEKPIRVMNEMFLGSYPRNYKDMIIPSFQFAHCVSAQDVNLGFLNVAYIKQFLHPFGEKRILKKWINNGEKNKVIFIYSLDQRFFRITKYVKKINASIPVLVAVLDLPEHIMKERDRNLLTKLWKKHMCRVVEQGMKKIDGLMVVAKGQIERLGVPAERCVVVEAITNIASQDYEPLKASDKKRIVYAGTLARQYNILDLVNAFLKIDRPDVELIICGDGNTKQEIVEIAEKDTRIKYLGVLSKQQVREVMKSAWALVNPREKGQGFTRYSFPSKTADYMAAGRPVICQKLEAIPDEYDQYLLYFDSNGRGRDLVEVLNELLAWDIDRINAIGKASFKFISENKNAKVQTKRILDLMYALQKG